MIAGLFHHVKKLFLHGFFTIFPITATILIVHFGYKVIATWVAPVRHFMPSMLHAIPGADFFLIILLILTFGALLRLFIISSVIQQIEGLINKIPLIRIVYSSSKILVDFFNVPNPATVKKKVVLVEFPRKGTYNIAFLLSSAKDNFQNILPHDREKNQEFFKVFMPNSPNPTTGYFMILPKEEIIDTNITFEEAIKTIVSCGIHTPANIQGNPFNNTVSEPKKKECQEQNKKTDPTPPAEDNTTEDKE